MGAGEEQKHCSICGLVLKPDMDRCPRCGNVIRKRHEEILT